ncbi:hypothetical protein AVEN_181841-1 [Araneus ventricosus]|uniref:SOCS box domain-containing protein n=1 Tax=Araneus ventricosus TaxID=182803 RepID=A0A4Y2EYK0_ARAVE|nr:hypothetical protein AVEN_181841-1 [Araneus ventricosus]
MLMELQYPSYIDLDKAENIVKYSFVVHKSVTSLDLSVCEYSVFKGKRQGHPLRIDKTYPPLIDWSNNFISTEEDCRKSLTEERQLLYAHHLDSSARLESSLRNVQSCQKRNFYSPSMFLSQVDTDYDLYEDNLSDMILETLKTTDQKVDCVRKVTKIMKKLDYLKDNFAIVFLCLEILYEHCTDSNIVKDFLTAFNFKAWIVNIDRPKLLQFLLYHANQARYNVWGNDVPHKLINRCVSNHLFGNSTILLKYYDAPVFSESMYKDVIHHIGKRRPSLSDDVLKHPVKEGWLSKERNFLMLQILDIFFHGPSPSSKLALSRIWKSIPKAFISQNELSRAYNKVLSPTDIEEIYAFYSNTVEEEEIHKFCKNVTEEDTQSCKPRSLKQFCRTTIRKTLNDSKKLPQGIHQLCLPRQLQSFLRLEM